ncbi:DNA-directed RNA polymerase subunit alpha C-terminal domain-containing protein [Stomatobaculum longum]|uniref:DNA-directed RNA polymerase subunit alpha C-terminal domain-containing protein n=1 Tax=Stomatobaculum longum TaxID=796942 RepID=UPI0028EB3EAE|nr:DNA-directed RNA polymerase subunit alpha C-terminal domain-containing protein [Stomatobaculum longum]
MKNWNDMAFGRQEKVSVFSLRFPADGKHVYYKTAGFAADRFLQASELLPAGGFLGVELLPERGAKQEFFLFSAPDEAVSDEDYSWIFENCAAEEPTETKALDSLFAEGRKVYALAETASGEAVATAESNSFTVESYYRRDAEECYRLDLVLQLYELLLQEGGRLRMVAASSAGSENSAHTRGRILLSLPNAISLRLRAQLALTFPGTEMQALSEEAETETKKVCVSESYLSVGMIRFLLLLFALERQQEKSNAEEVPEEWKEPENCRNPILIEDLDLSKRSYNCLKHAGILTVEQLKRLSEDELRRIRNMGLKSVREIQYKLEEIRNIPAISQLPEKDYFAELETLIGLNEVKTQVKKIAAFAKMQKEMKALGKGNLSVALNMEFSGNPGTAKTTVARILAGILNQVGILESAEIVEVGRASLVAGYVGQTAERVREVFRSAKGKVLFIDEAYSLVEHWEGGYGDEAINTIVQEMENNREDTVVIFAGYPKQMEDFFARNPGLRSRVPFQLNFQDYAVEELLKITALEAARYGFALSPEAEEEVRKLAVPCAKEQSFGNGRFCRNLVENALLSYAQRVYGEEEGTETEAAHDFVLRAEDFAAPEVQAATKKTVIGFQPCAA